MGASPALLLAAAALLGSLICAQGACQGNACTYGPGLLGAGSCTPQTYPKIGSVQPVTIPSRILDLKWAGGPGSSTNDQYIFALTADMDGFDGGPLWRSDSSGSPSSWADMSSKLQAALPAGESTSTGVVALHWHVGKPERILLQGKGRTHWVTADYGATVKAVPTPKGTQGFSQEIKTHPNQVDWLLAKVRRDECLLDRRSKLCGYDLFLSQDFGSSWTNLTEQSAGRITSFRDFDWGTKMAMFAGKPTPDETIFATVYQSESSQKGMYPGWDKDLHYVVSTDFFKTPVQKQVPCGNLFEVVGHKVYLAVPSDCPIGPDGKPRSASKHSISGRTVTMYVSDADGDDFTEACLPVNLEDDGYNLIHTHDDYGSFILADHAEEGSRGPTSDSPVSDVYAPAYNASIFTLSIRSVYRRDFVVDFTRIEGLPGVYMANSVDDSALGPGARPGTRPSQFMRTKISFNGGASWDSLSPPSSFRYAQCNTCPQGSKPEDCRLHLHGPTSWFAPEGPRPNVYAQSSAPGLLLATGNVGAHLDFAATTTCTYLSRDGGQTWEDVADNPAIYEIGAHGDLIAMSPHKSEGPSDIVLFSLDQGACWHKVTLPEAITVDNIRVSSSGGGHTFVVHGQACVKTEARPACTFVGGDVPPAKMFVLDIQNLMQGDWRECNTAAESPDFEPWTLVKPNGCLLGSQYTVQRRKRDANCVSGSAYQPPATKVAPCNCSASDLECEFGFERVNGSCVAMAGLESNLCPTLTNGAYKASTTNARLVHADVCVGLDAVISDTDGKGNWGGGGGGGCDHHDKGSGGSSGWKTFFILALVTGILLTLGGVVWAHLLPAGLKEDIAAKAGPALGAAGAVLGALFEKVLDLVITAWDWARAKLGGHPSDSAARAAYFEPLSDRLELDPEDHTSPPLFGNR